MKLATMPRGGTNYTPAPEGTHLAICTMVVDTGTHEKTGKYGTKRERQIYLAWELPDETFEAQGENIPYTIGRTYNASMNEKSTLRNHLERWRGQTFTEQELSDPVNGFDLRNVLGKPCLLAVIHTEREGKLYANIDGVSKIMKGQKAPERTHNPLIYFSLEDPDMEAFNALSEYFQKKIMESPEWEAVTSGRAAPPPVAASYDLNDDIPF